ncbi:MAG: hypothetical protein Q8T08_13750, partial [Ignavibacteria bacterium]|nr:hypothetical protein [Ignavibacteria bacterium]
VEIAVCAGQTVVAKQIGEKGRITMEKERDTIKELFKTGLHDLKVEPPKEIWEAIAAAQKPKRKLAFYYRIASAAAVLLLLISIPLWLMLPRDTVEKDVLSESIQLETIIDNTQNIQSNQEILEDQKASDLMADSFTKSSKVDKQTNNTFNSDSNKKTKESSQDEAIAKNNEVNGKDILAEIEVIEQNQISSNPSSDEASAEIASLTLKIIPNPEDELADMQDDFIKSKQNIHFSLGYGGYSDGALNSNDLSYADQSASFSFDPYDSEVAYETTFFEEIDYTEARPPVSLAFKINFGLSKRFSFESGITYTQLSTITKTIENNESHSEYKRTLYYIGLPLGLRFDVLRGKKSLVYLQQSVVIEKGIRATNTTSRFEFNKRVESFSGKSPIYGMQISTVSSAGLDLRVFNQFSLFGEGGVQVFYLNETQPFNIRSAKKVWPVFQTGIRLKM